METVLANAPIAVDIPPPSVVTARIDAETGLLAATGSKNAIMEMFMAEHAPTETAPLRTDAPDVFNPTDDAEAPAVESEEPLFWYQPDTTVT